MDKALKQRLVGATVLIILAVIVLPMLLSGRSETLKQESRQIELPAKPDELSIETRRFPVGAPNRPVTEMGPGGKEQPRVAEAGETAVKSESPPIESNTHTGADQPRTAPVDSEKDTGSTDQAADSKTGDEKPSAVTSIVLNNGPDTAVNNTPLAESGENAPRYLVQVASFSSEKNANALATRLRSDHLPVMMDVVERTAGRLHRVRVGPYVTRSEADKVVASLRAAIKDLAPRVLDMRPDESAPVSTPSDPLVRWVVQVGSFSRAEAAGELVGKLRLAGLKAFSEKVTSVEGTAYRVRVGPEIDRDQAVELARKIKAEYHLDNFVTTQD